MADSKKIALEARMRNLAQTFSALAGAPGVDPWDLDKFISWVEGPRSHGERVSGYFILLVWNHYDWGKKFDFVDAMGVWDQSNRRAFLAWVSDPWWG